MQPQVQMALPVNSRDMAEVDTILSRAIAAGDPLIAAEYGNQLSKTITLKGVTLANLLRGQRVNLPLFRASGIEDEFIDFVDAHMMIASATAVKYADMYQAVFANGNVPEIIKEQLKGKPIKTLLLLTAAVREGDLSEEQLSDVVVLDHNGVRDVIREARGDVTSSKLRVYGRLIQRENAARYPQGTLLVFGNENGDIEAIGQFNLRPKSDAGKKFLARAIRALQLEDMTHDE